MNTDKPITEIKIVVPTDGYKHMLLIGYLVDVLELPYESKLQSPSLPVEQGEVEDDLESRIENAFGRGYALGHEGGEQNEWHLDACWETFKKQHDL